MNIALLLAAMICGGPTETVEIELGPVVPYTWQFDGSDGFKMRVTVDGKQFRNGMPNTLSVDLFANCIGWSVKRWEVVEPEPFARSYGCSEQVNSWFLHFDEHTPPEKIVLELWFHREPSDRETTPYPAEWMLDPDRRFLTKSFLIRTSGRYFSEPENRMHAMLAEFRKHYPACGFAPIYKGEYPDWEPVGVTLRAYDTTDTPEHIREKLQPIAERFRMKLDVERTEPPKAE